MVSPQPENEAERLKVLHALGILDTEPDNDFEEISRLAALICGTPMAAISLIDRDRQWFQSAFGMGLKETPRDVAFCATTILGRELFVVPDACADENFADNPLVTSGPRIRFYAGAPLVTSEGHGLGALCVMDRSARQLTPEQGRALQTLSRQVMARYQLRQGLIELTAVNEALRAEVAQRQKAEEALRLANNRLDLAVRGSNIGIWEIDMPDGDYRHGHRYHVNIWEQLGYERPDIPTDHETGMVPVHPDNRPALEAAMRGYLAGEAGEFEVENRVRHKDGSYRWMLTRGVAVRDSGGKPIRFVGIAVDITDLKRVEEELRESEHRWRSLTETLPQLVWTAAPDGACDYFSRQWTEHTGAPEEDLLGWRWLSVLHPDDRERTRELWLDSVAGRGPYDVEYRVRRLDGV